MQELKFNFSFICFLSHRAPNCTNKNLVMQIGRTSSRRRIIKEPPRIVLKFHWVKRSVPSWHFQRWTVFFLLITDNFWLCHQTEIGKWLEKEVGVFQIWPKVEWKKWCFKLYSSHLQSWSNLYRSNLPISTVFSLSQFSSTFSKNKNRIVPQLGIINNSEQRGVFFSFFPVIACP